MQNNIIKRKVFATIFIIILTIVGFSPVTQSIALKENSTHIKNILNIRYEGTLSGYVEDSESNPIEGALVRVYFHETYREDYSDSAGYYHVVDIPICYCLKNATCSKEGYKTEWVLLPIYKNTTYDFTLYPLGPCYPVFNGTLGWNGWYISSVEVSFIYDPEEVAEIWYYYKGWHNYTEPFIIDEEGGIRVDFYWINHEGFPSPITVFNLKIDKTPPITLLQWDVYKIGLRWYAKFILTAEDPLSGLTPNLLIYINDLLQAEFFVTTWPTFEFKFQWSKSLKFLTFGFQCFDNAGNMAYESVNGSDIKSFNINQRFSTQKFLNICLERFIKNFVILLLNF